MKMFHSKAPIMELKNKSILSLTELANGKDFKKDPLAIAEDVKKHFNVDPKTISQAVNRQELRALKDKSNYSLYKMYESSQKMLDSCDPVLSELYPKNENGELTLGIASEIISNVSEENKVLINEAFDLYKKVDGKPDELRKAFIKEKIISNRYSRRGAEFAQLFANLTDDIFALSSLCVSLQLIMVDLLENHSEETV